MVIEWDKEDELMHSECYFSCECGKKYVDKDSVIKILIKKLDFYRNLNNELVKELDNLKNVLNPSYSISEGEITWKSHIE